MLLFQPFQYLVSCRVVLFWGDSFVVTSKNRTQSFSQPELHLEALNAHVNFYVGILSRSANLLIERLLQRRLVDVHLLL